MREPITAQVRPTTRKLAKIRAKEMERSLSGYIEWLIEADISGQIRSGQKLDDGAEAAAFAEKIIATNEGLFRRLAK